MKEMTLVLPLPGRREVMVQTDWPLSQVEWELVMSMLDVMRPGLVDADATSSLVFTGGQA